MYRDGYLAKTLPEIETAAEPVNEEGIGNESIIEEPVAVEHAVGDETPSESDSQEAANDPHDPYTILGDAGVATAAEIGARHAEPAEELYDVVFAHIQQTHGCENTDLDKIYGNPLHVDGNWQIDTRVAISNPVHHVLGLPVEIEVSVWPSQENPKHAEYEYGAAHLLLTVTESYHSIQDGDELRYEPLSQEDTSGFLRDMRVILAAEKLRRDQLAKAVQTEEAAEVTPAATTLDATHAATAANSKPNIYL